jgi:hypothetical protein
MEPFDRQIVTHQRGALDFMLDALGLQHAREEADDAVRSLEPGRPAPGLLREHRRLRQRLAALADELEAVEAEFAALDRAVDNRIDAQRERRLEDI